MTGFRHLGDTDVHQGYVWRVVVAEFESPNGESFRRDIVRSPGAVGVVPLVFDPEGLPSVVLVRQYRPPYQRNLIEIPAGMRDVPGEPAAETGRRELIEEAGLAAGAYLVAHALFLERGGWSGRLRAFLPYAAIVVLWRLGYSAMGHGAAGSDQYIDPVRDPLDFLIAAAELP